MPFPKAAFPSLFRSLLGDDLIPDTVIFPRLTRDTTVIWIPLRRLKLVPLRIRHLCSYLYVAN